MARAARQQTQQSCPNCNAVHDVGVYVTGQRVRCKCGLSFEVRRTDVSNPGKEPAITFAPRSVAPPRAQPIELDSQLGFEPTIRPASRGAHAEPSEPGPIEVTAAPAQRTPLLPGYELLEVLGRGGMGEVWRARQLSLDRVVAVKLLPPKLASDPEFVRRFEKEATALASLSHPNVIQIFDRGVAGEHYYFAMEYVEGRSLRQVLNAGRVPAEEALKIVAQICRAIDYAHEQGIVHRDLKPENILFDARGHVKVADFGLAGIRGPDSRLQMTATSVAMGTVNYMAPEQRRDAKNVDGRADLYSLGVLLYELLTGDLPLGRFKLPSERISGLDVRIDEVVARALESEPEARFQRASAIGKALEEVIGSGVGSSVSLTPTPLPASEKPAAPPRQSMIERSFGGLKTGLAITGALALLAVALRLLPARLPSQSASDSPQTSTQAGRQLPPNTYGELFADLALSEEQGRTSLASSFDEGTEEINAHAGSWSLANGVLSSMQAGSETGEGVLKLVPRAYLAHRYFSTDDFSAEVDLLLRPLGEQFAVEQDAQVFGELALRIKDLQVSVFAIPEAGMRLGWRYFTPDGVEVFGNSVKDLESLVDDETPVPKGRFRVRLSLQRKKNAVEVEAFVNGRRFAKKTLVGLQGQIGKVALGCRNLHCEFDNLKAVGKAQARPQPK